MTNILYTCGIITFLIYSRVFIIRTQKFCIWAHWWHIAQNNNFYFCWWCPWHSERTEDGQMCTSENLFGFKKKHATDLCIYTVKSVIKYYNSPVFTCFLDASKAFDRVNHWTLFKKLLLKGVPTVLVRILCFWYRSQHLCIQRGKTKSLISLYNNKWCSTGGILSPKLFSVYMDDW